MVPGFDADLILALNLAGTFVFGLSGGIAGVVGTLVVLGAGSGLFLVLRRREREPA